MYLLFCINQETNIQLFILAVYYLVYFFQNITETSLNTRSTQNIWLCSEIVSFFTVHVKMLRIFRYMLPHILSRLRTIRHSLIDYLDHKLSNIRIFVCLPDEVQLAFFRSNQVTLCSD